jgi:hypothetical protein
MQLAAQLDQGHRGVAEAEAAFDHLSLTVGEPFECFGDDF